MIVFMQVFVYEAVDRDGKRVKAKVQAVDMESLKESLRKEGYIPLSISPFRESRFRIFRRAGQKDLLILTQELASLIGSGLPLDRAILILSQHAEKHELREVLNEIYKDLQQGKSLSEAMRRHRIFPKLYVNMVRSGETGGVLEPVLMRIVSFLETTTAFKEEVLSVLIYPILLTIVGSASIAVLMLYVIPKFAIIFEEMGQSLPLPTMILLNTSHFIVRFWWLGVALVLAILYLVKRYKDTDEGRLFMDRILLRIPVVSKLQTRLYISRFARTMGTLLKSGVPILKAIRISREVIGNEVVSRRLEGLEEGVRKGRGISQPLRESGVFPEIVLQMVAVGEEAGRLEETFLNIAERFESETRSMIKRLIAFIEPAIILLMGLMVAFIVISMLLAIFSINEIPL
ncbi:MAG TPA: type II secretion system F family protein [Nitrospirae bacterium]|nr:type II secretion system F family protein [Nitrospirota bacterium]